MSEGERVNFEEGQAGAEAEKSARDLASSQDLQCIVFIVRGAEGEGEGVGGVN